MAREKDPSEFFSTAIDSEVWLPEPQSSLKSKKIDFLFLEHAGFSSKLYSSFPSWSIERLILQILCMV